jgi:predicted acyltransferase
MPPSASRLASLDVFRGATVAAMLLVNNPGSWGAIYGPLDHAEWHGWTATDLIFPFFLFIVGITTELSRKEPRGILRRGALIVLFGLLLNAFPFYWWGKIAGVPEPSLVERVVYRFAHLRYLGVLQRIGIVYTIAALVAWKASRRQIVALTVVLLAGYAFALTRGPLEPPEATVAAAVDRAVLGESHIWSSTRTWDPEGPLSTIPAIATCLLGVLAAQPVRERKLGVLFGAGVAGLVSGLVWNVWLPINKNLWTSSYVLFTAGYACVLLALCIWVVDVKGVRGWIRPFVVFGINPLVAFVGSGVMARLLSIVKVDGLSLQAFTYRHWFAPYFEPPQVASLLWGLAFVGVWLAILWAMARRGLVLRV